MHFKMEISFEVEIICVSKHSLSVCKEFGSEFVFQGGNVRFARIFVCPASIRYIRFWFARKSFYALAGIRSGFAKKSVYPPS